MRHIPVAIELEIRVALDRDSTRVGKSAQSYFTSDILYKICDISSSYQIRWNNVFWKIHGFATVEEST